MLSLTPPLRSMKIFGHTAVAPTRGTRSCKTIPFLPPGLLHRSLGQELDCLCLGVVGTLFAKVVPFLRST